MNNISVYFFSVLATLNERFRHCLSMTKMLNSENLLGDSGLEPHSTPCTADKILYGYAIEQCQAAALDELFGNPEECFQVSTFFKRKLKLNQDFSYL
jgi:serine/threonine-protein kinase ULK/ATG1